MSVARMVGWDSQREHSCGRAGQSPAARRTSVLPSLNASSSPWGEPEQLLGASAFMVYPKDRVGLERELLLVLGQWGSLPARNCELLQREPWQFLQEWRTTGSPCCHKA